MAAIIETCKDVLRTSPIYEKRENEFYLRQKRKSELFKNNPAYQQKAEKIAPKANNVFNAIQIMDNYSENYAEDMEKAMGTVLMIVLGAMLTPLYGLEMWLLKNSKMQGTKSKLVGLIPIIPAFLLAMATSPLIAKKQIQASRTGRYKSIKNELSDVRNFVIYTPEQIEQAKNLTVDTDNKKSKKNNKSNNYIQGTVKILKDFRKDYTEYKKLRQANTQLDEEFEKKLSGDYSSSEIEKAQEDKELILTATKIINNKAEDYSENTENAYATLQSLESILSWPIGLGIGTIASKFIKKTSPVLVKIYSVCATTLFTMGLLTVGTQRQKLASRVGRYMAEKEMKNDMSSVMYFDENEINKIDIKNDCKKRGFFGKIYNNLIYLKKYNKDCNEYLEYQKTQGKADKKLFENLKKVDITPEQLKDAEKLQKKVLFVFDEIDEMSQSYSENVEAATDMASQLYIFLTELLMIGLGTVLAIRLNNRKFKLTKMVNKIANIVFKDNSVIKKSVNEIEEIAKESKQTRKKIDEIFYNNLSIFKHKTINSDPELEKRIAPHVINIKTKFNEILTGDISKNLKSEIKQNKFAQYLYNLLTDILKEKPRIARNKAKRLGKKYEPKPPQSLIERLQNALDDGKSEKMGKTLRNTLIIGGVPIASVIFLVPFAIQSWFTNIQKKAGKIGVMKALDNVNDVKYYT